MARVQLHEQPHDHAPYVEITLSERNLIILLSKLYTDGSRRTIIVGDVSDEFAYALVRCESDDVHYASPTRQGAPAGPMHPLTELIHTTIKAMLPSPN